MEQSYPLHYCIQCHLPHNRTGYEKAHVAQSPTLSYQTLEFTLSIVLLTGSGTKLFENCIIVDNRGNHVSTGSSKKEWGLDY